MHIRFDKPRYYFLYVSKLKEKSNHSKSSHSIYSAWPSRKRTKIPYENVFTAHLTFPTSLSNTLKSAENMHHLVALWELWKVVAAQTSPPQGQADVHQSPILPSSELSPPLEIWSLARQLPLKDHRPPADSLSLSPSPPRLGCIGSC